jgi:membrane protease subunit HflK
VSRFLSLQKEYEKGPDITRTRLYLEALEKVLPRVRLYVVDSNKGRVPMHLRLSGP